jgi:hypothetical protein
MDDSPHPAVGAAPTADEALREAVLAHAERRDGPGYVRERSVAARDAAIPALARLEPGVADLRRREI